MPRAYGANRDTAPSTAAVTDAAIVSAVRLGEFCGAGAGPDGRAVRMRAIAGPRRDSAGSVVVVIGRAPLSPGAACRRQSAHLNAEIDHHLAGEEPGNRRHGYGRKTVLTDTGRIELAVPRDRRASFDPQLIAKYQRRFPGFADKIISMYARGMSTREIVGHLRGLCGIEVSPDPISAATDAMPKEVAAWQVPQPRWSKRITRYRSGLRNRIPTSQQHPQCRRRPAVNSRSRRLAPRNRCRPPAVPALV